MQYSLNNSGIQGFCPLKIKITQFPSGQDSILMWHVYLYLRTT